jgi:CubicO group peptidase (beta-lactamase class C family)
MQNDLQHAVQFAVEHESLWDRNVDGAWGACISACRIRLTTTVPSTSPHRRMAKKGDLRPLQSPGTYWEYNDVRINQLSLALLYLFRQPLPEVFRDAIMRPAGASENWQWVGYDNAWVEIDGRRMQSVPGGTHWGGEISVSANDQLKVAQLLLDDGTVASRQILSREWISRMRTPCALAPFYGYLVWLNTDRKIFPNTPASSYFGVGAGSSFTWIEPERRMAVIVRWLNPAYADEFFGRVLEAVDTPRTV